MSLPPIYDVDRIMWADFEGFEGAFRERVLAGREDRTAGLIMFATLRLAETVRIAKWLAERREELVDPHDIAQEILNGEHMAGTLMPPPSPDTKT